MEFYNSNFMISTEQKIIFLNSYLPRTGHNFSSEVLKIFSRHQVLAHSRSETRLSTLLNSYFNIYDQHIYHESDKKFFDHLFMDDLRKKIIDSSDKKFILIKDTSFMGTDLLPRVFPNDHHIILIRDPKSVFLSLLKGMNLQQKNLKNKLKKIGIFTGIYPYYYSRKLSSKIMRQFPNLNYHTIIKYEDLVMKEEKVLLLLKEKFDTKKSLTQIKKEIDDIEVINSSFYEETGGNKIWDSKPKTSNFDPVNRKGGSFVVNKAVELGSRKFRKKLNYI